VICGALLCLSLTASAQDSAAALDTSSTAAEPGMPAEYSPTDREAWQLDVGYQYQHYKVLGQTFHDQGYHVGVTRYLSNWYGIEADAVMGFGHTSTPLNLVAKSFFVGGGPHISIYRTKRLEPWTHALVGWQHFRFSQSSTVGSNSALGFMAGGGVDYKISDALSWRIQGDFIGSHFQNTIDKNYSFGTGVVLNF
jgi:opacity protein-like surface antigen